MAIRFVTINLSVDTDNPDSFALSLVDHILETFNDDGSIKATGIDVDRLARKAQGD